MSGGAEGVCVPAAAVFLMTVFGLSRRSSQIRGVPLGRLSRGQLCALLRSGRPVDAERAAGGHAGHRGDRPSEARAGGLLPAAGGQRAPGSKRGAGPVDGDGAVGWRARQR